MTSQALSDYVFVSKYARFDSAVGRRETYSEAVGRMFDMHYRRYPRQTTDLLELEQLVRDGKILGSQRALQFGGAPMESKNARGYNCCSSFADRPRFFQEAFWLLLCGCGVGFSVQKHHVGKLPEIHQPTHWPSVFEIPDTIEGWADALGHLVSSYFVPDSPVVLFDYDKIRPEGAPLSSGTGKAPGPVPLETALENVRRRLDLLTREGSTQLRPIDVYDVVMFAAEAVLSGGIRRSATIALFSPDDEQMIRAKTGNWLATNPQRKYSNNSALLLRGATDWEVFDHLIQSTREFGEPGFVWASSREHVVNPCVEISFYPVDEVTGESGWQFCNLSVINAAACSSPEEFWGLANAAARLGTYQAGYTSFDYLGPVSERITRREALLGVSITGIQDNPEIALDSKTLAVGAAEVVAANEKLAAEIGINPAARTTCVKPEGTSSCLLQTASGIHPRHARRYFRRVQANALEEPAKHFRTRNPLAVEDDSWKAGNLSLIFCVEAPEDATTSSEVNALRLLNDVRTLKASWVDPGKVVERCVDSSLSHNVSNTISVREWEWDVVGRYLYDHQRDFAGVAMLPASADLDYPQAPLLEVLTEIEIAERFGPGALLASGLIVDALRAFEDIWRAVDAAEGGRIGLFVGTPDTMQVDWIRRAVQFADRYFAGDMQRTGQALKHVHNFKLWQDLTRTYRSVDYTEIENEDGTDVDLASVVACAGGVCEII